MTLQTRRDFSKLALAAIPAAGLINLLPSARAADANPGMMTVPAGPKPNSRVNGVHIGMNAPYNYGTAPTGADNLSRTLQLGISALELRSGPVELYMGAPGGGGRGGGGGGGAAAAGIPGTTAEQNAAVASATANLAAMQTAVATAQTDLVAASWRSPKNANELAAKAKALADAELNLAQARADAMNKIQMSPQKLSADQLLAFQQQNGAPRGRGAAPAGRGAAAPAAPAALSDIARWRAAASMDKAREFRRIYEDAGVFIEIMKFDNVPGFTEDELDYAFTLARTCGARAISLEMPGNEQTKRIGAMADRHRMQVGYHNHTDPANLPEWLVAFEQSKYNGANVDIGHFVGGNVGGDQFKSPVDFIRKYPDRVTHIHVKDKMTAANGGANKPFGEGETPIVETLRAIRDNKWLIQATIEFEYPVPAGSDRMAEIAKTVKYCRDALAS